MPKLTQKAFHKFLQNNPVLEIVRHPNPKGLGFRKFSGLKGGEYTFDLPSGEVSYLQKSNDAALTDNGFTILAGRIVYEVRQMRPYDSETDYPIILKACREEGRAGFVPAARALEAAGIIWPKLQDNGGNRSPDQIAMSNEIDRAWVELGYTKPYVEGE